MARPYSHMISYAVCANVVGVLPMVSTRCASSISDIGVDGKPIMVVINETSLANCPAIGSSVILCSCEIESVPNHLMLFSASYCDADCINCTVSANPIKTTPTFSAPYSSISETTREFSMSASTENSNDS